MENKYVVGFEGECFVYGYEWEMDTITRKGDLRWADAVPLKQARALQRKLKEINGDEFKVIIYKLTPYEEK